MHLSLAPLIARGVDVLGELLPSLGEKFGPGFSVAADCGAGVGYTTRLHLAALRKGLAASGAAPTIYAYEPLPENVEVLRAAFAAEPACVVRPVAVSDVSGEANFTVPNRLPVDWNTWKAGTSYGGFLADPVDWYEQITVQTVRLEDEAPERFDFVKLDLQGGEHKALLGLGAKLDHAKLLYVEHPLLTEVESIAMLRDRGFEIRFDGVFFGVSGNRADLDALAALGLRVKQDHLIPTEGDGDLIVDGYLEPRSDLINKDTLSLHPEVARRFQDLGVTWLHTDVLAIHPAIRSDVLGVLERL